MKHYLDFEKPILELQRKLEELRKHRETHSLGIDLDEEIRQIEGKIEEERKRIFSDLTPWQRVQLARHPLRPFSLDYIQSVFTDFSELHGDRLFSDDRAMIGGFALLEGHRVVVLGTQKGRDTKENIRRNFGSAHPEGYRKALRLMRLAAKFSLPIITLIDTAGAYPGIGAEERHIAEAIAVNLREMMLMEVPVVAVVIGEGGSGGALGIGVADRVLILENAYYSVISPEGCAAILWKDRSAAAKAAEALRITAKDLLELGLVDEIVPEPLGGAHNDPAAMAAALKASLLRSLLQLRQLEPAELLRLRYAKYRSCGRVAEKTRPRPARPVDRNATALYPLVFQPIFKERLWGGRTLETLYGKRLPADLMVGESWEIADRPGDVSVIAEGPLAGRDLRWLVETQREALLGSARLVNGRFPLLIKILDARETLSLQVHPPAQVATRLNGEPKTELWYLADAQPGAELFAGLRRGVTRALFEEKLQAGAVADCFHRVPVRSGDAMFVPSGRVHAIGRGCTIFEIQENSDTTYRVFDWNRVAPNGQPRELHVAASLQSIDFNDVEPGLIEQKVTQEASGVVRPLVSHDLFEVEVRRLAESASWDCPAPGAVILALLAGRLRVADDAQPVTLRPGQFCLIPASLRVARLEAEGAAEFLVVRPR